MSAHRAPSAALAAALIGLVVTPALAQWPQGYSVTVGTDDTARGVARGFCYPGETGGDFYVSFGAWGGVGLADWQVAHLGTNGQLLWSATDVHLINGVRLIFDGAFAPTGLGGFASAYPNGDLYAQIGDPTGIQSYSDIGAPAYSSSDEPSCCRADGGGAYVAWVSKSGLRLQRLGASGAIAAGWPAAGWVLKPGMGVSLVHTLATAPDGTGGLLLCSNVDISPGPLVQRVSGDTAVVSGWPASGLRMITSGNGGVTASFSATPRLVRSDATHFFAVWVDVPLNGGERVMCQRFSLAGTLDPAWPPDGVELDSLASDYHENLACVGDGAGGVTVGWSETQRYRARHVRADGTMPGLYAGGPLALFSGMNVFGSIGIAMGGLAQGKDDGCCVFWNDQATGIRGRWFDGGGYVLGCGAPGDTCSALILAGPLSYWRVPAAMADGNGGAYILYAGYVDANLEDHYVTHAHYLGDATASVPPVGPRPSLALAVSPNPAHGALLARFTLPDARPARLELLDLAGRRVLARDVSGAGDHVERLEVPGSLAAGVYLVSAAQGHDRRTARVVVIR